MYQNMITDPVLAFTSTQRSKYRVVTNIGFSPQHRVGAYPTMPSYVAVMFYEGTVLYNTSLTDSCILAYVHVGKYDNVITYDRTVLNDTVLSYLYSLTKTSFFTYHH